jgi:hypothetical protein
MLSMLMGGARRLHVRTLSQRLSFLNAISHWTEHLHPQPRVCLFFLASLSGLESEDKSEDFFVRWGALGAASFVIG